MRNPLSALAGVRPRGDNKWTARCPAHDDHRPSLSVEKKEDRWLVHCFAGCTYDAIMAAAHLTPADMMSPATRGSTGGAVPVYDYHDEHGTVVYQIRRFPPKDFRAFRPDGAGGFLPGMNGAARVLYHLHELRGQPIVYLVEGEKDCDRLRGVGLAATTAPFGAGKWRPEYVAQLRGAGARLVVVIADNDPAGAAHARTAARSCADAGLSVKLIATLPDVPEKGDVSDYLDRHTASELRAIVDGAPLFNPAHPVAIPPPVTLETLADFLAQPESAITWIVQDRIPAGAVFLFCGAPKSGKSTTVRELAVAVAHGEPWLGCRTTAGRVWLLSFEDQPSEIRRHLRRLHATPTDPISVFTGSPPADLIPRLETLAATDPPALIIIDTLIRTLRVRDLNDYAQVAAAFKPLHQLARTTNAAVVVVHHASSHADREGLNAILGSTAIAGSVDNFMLLRRDGNRRTIATTQRIGPELEPVIVELDEASGRLKCAGTKRIVEGQELRERIMEAMAAAGEPLTESQIQSQIDGRKTDKVRALRTLLSQGRVERTGLGKSGNPYLYHVSGSQNPVPGTRLGNPREPDFSEERSINPGLFDEKQSLVPETCGPQYVVRSQYVVKKVDQDVRTSPDQTPNTTQSETAETSKTSGKHGAKSGSQNPDDGDDDEQF